MAREENRFHKRFSRHTVHLSLSLDIDDAEEEEERKCACSRRRRGYRANVDVVYTVI